MADCDKKKRVRTANFTDCEIKTLIEKVSEVSDVLFDKLSATVTAKRKDRLWVSITEAVNARGNCSRTVKQCRKKWSELRGKTIHFANKKKNIPTGGGPMEETPWWVDAVLSIIGADNCVISGIPLDLPGESHVQVVPEEVADHYNPEQYLDDGHDAEPVWDLLNTADPPACMDISVAEKVIDTQETVFNTSTSTLDVSFSGPAVKEADGSSVGGDPMKKQLPKKTSVKGPTATDRLANLQKRKRRFDNDGGQEGTKWKKEKKTVELVEEEIHRVQLEAEKLQVEIEKLQVEKEKLQVEKEKLQVEKEVAEMKKGNEMRKRIILERQLNVQGDSGVQKLMRNMNIPLDGNDPCLTDN